MAHNYANALQWDRDTLAARKGGINSDPAFIFHYAFLPQAQFRESYASEQTTNLVENNTAISREKTKYRM